MDEGLLNYNALISWQPQCCGPDYVTESYRVDDGLVGTEIQCKREDAEMMTKILQLVTIGISSSI